MAPAALLYVRALPHPSQTPLSNCSASRCSCRPTKNITTLAAALGVASLRARCPDSLLLTRAGSSAAAVADVMDVMLMPGGAAMELLLRVVDNPVIVPEHDSKHPWQVYAIVFCHWGFVCLL
jgi:hypothetical protein